MAAYRVRTLAALMIVVLALAVSLLVLSPAVAGQVGPDGVVDYESNIDMIKAQSDRNTNHDDSAFGDVPQSELDITTGGGLVDLNRAAYLGNPNGNPEQSFPTDGGGNFRTSWEFSHFAYDDPLLTRINPVARTSTCSSVTPT